MPTNAWEDVRLYSSIFHSVGRRDTLHDAFFGDVRGKHGTQPSIMCTTSTHLIPGRLTGGEESLVGLGHDWEGRPRPPLPRCLALCLAQALDIAATVA